MASAFGSPPGGFGFQRAVHASGAGRLLAARDAGGPVVATGGALSFGATGWIGGVTVAPAAQRRGLATAVTRLLSTWLAGRGAQTTLLLATEAGERVYERLGFVGEGELVTYSGELPGGGAAAPALAPGDGAGASAVRALDAAATSEDRAVALGFAPAGWVLPGRGYRLAPSWPRSPLVALDPAAGATLLDAAGGPTMLDVPAANAAARDAVLARGLRERYTTRRMRLGPPVGWRPERVWSAISLFCG
jgi:acetyltransferase (GNAT) family protein